MKIGDDDAERARVGRDAELKVGIKSAFLIVQAFVRSLWSKELCDCDNPQQEQIRGDAAAL